MTGDGAAVNREIQMKEVIDYYNDIAAKYDDDRFNNTYGRFIDSEERKWLTALGAQTDFGRALEIACGTGRLTEFASVGVDASKEMLAIAKRRFPDKEFIEADARKIPLPDASFDTIYSFHLMMHLAVEDINLSVDEAYRLLRPGGRLIFDIPSLVRRKKLHYNGAQGWHGATSLTTQQVKEMTAGKFSQGKVFGILFLPIHKVPKRFRKMLLGLDSLLCRSCLKEYSSYLLFELRKQ